VPVLAVDPHPLLDLGAFETSFAAPLLDTPTPEPITRLMTLSPDAPVASDDAVQKAVRNLLRHGGYKPAGRGKPASEYLRRADAEGGLARINVAVDACNAVSLHSGLPISVVDLDRTEGSLRVGIADDVSYIFNAAGQEIKVAGLLCLHDARGPCANAVKDCMRTKTHPGTRRTLTLIWGTNALPGHTAQTLAWYVGLLEAAGATSRVLELPG
jgi:DNA/RNA-binding domain of Phe-tRNA-synthetase-like protein